MTPCLIGKDLINSSYNSKSSLPISDDDFFLERSGLSVMVSRVRTCGVALDFPFNPVGVATTVGSANC